MLSDDFRCFVLKKYKLTLIVFKCVHEKLKRVHVCNITMFTNENNQ